MPDVNFWVVRWIDADLVNHIVSRVWAADFSSSDFSRRAAHHPPGQSALLSALEEFGRVCGGIKKAPETSPPGTQQHLVTCSRRGRHNAALAMCCCCVSIATKFVLPRGGAAVQPKAVWCWKYSTRSSRRLRSRLQLRQLQRLKVSFVYRSVIRWVSRGILASHIHDTRLNGKSLIDSPYKRALCHIFDGNRRMQVGVAGFWGPAKDHLGHTLGRRK